MAHDIVKAESCDAPVEVAFEYLADYRRVPDWMFGVEKFEVVGEQDYGPGSVFDATMHLGVRLQARIQATEWEENRVIGMDSVKGFAVRSRWYFESTPDGGSTITANVSYRLPFGPAGRAMGKVVHPAIARAVNHSADRLRDEIEKLPSR